MTHTEFFKEVDEHFKDFVKYWEENHKKEPLIFPLEMSSGDWWEQFIMFNGEIKK